MKGAVTLINFPRECSITVYTSAPLCFEIERTKNLNINSKINTDTSVLLFTQTLPFNNVKLKEVNSITYTMKRHFHKRIGVS